MKHKYFSSRSYALLEELNTHPRLHYLARVTNPHPTLAPKEAPGGHGGGHGGKGKGGHGDDHGAKHGKEGAHG